MTKRDKLWVFGGIGALMAIGFIFLAVMFVNIAKDNEPKAADKAIKSEMKAKAKREEPAPVKAEAKPPVPAKQSTPSVITFAEFDKLHKRDPNEEHYPGGTFILMTGEKVTADYYSYTASDYFDNASAIYKDGKLVNLLLETTASVAEVEAGLGIEFNDSVKVEPTRIGYRITFNETFAKENIKVYPFEMD